MTYDKSNIVGVEFTVKGAGEDYKINWCDGENECTVKSLNRGGIYGYKVKDVLRYLNTKKWIVKNSKV